MAASGAVGAARAAAARIRGVFTGVEWTLSFVALLLYVFVIHSGKLNVGSLAVLTALVGLLLQSKPIRVPPPLIWFGLFVFWSLLTLVWTPYPATVWLRWQDLAKVWVIFFVVINAVRSRAQLRFFIVFWLGVYALYPLRGTVFNFLAGIGDFGRYALTFIFQNPNDLASLTFLPLALSLALLKGDEPRWVKLSALGGAILLPALIVITQSRGGLIALVITSLVVLAREKQRGRAILLLAATAGVITMVAPSAVWERVQAMTNLTSEETLGDADSSAEQRWVIWKVARAIIDDHPAAGVGYGAYGKANAEYARSNPDWSNARGERDTHGLYHNITAETGFVGLGLYFAFLISVIVGSIKAQRVLRANRPHAARQLQLLNAGLLGFYLACVFATLHGISFVYLYIAVIFILSDLTLTAEAEAQTGRAGGGRGGRSTMRSRSAARAAPTPSPVPALTR